MWHRRHQNEFFCAAKISLSGQMTYSVTTITFYLVQNFVCDQDHFLCGHDDNYFMLLMLFFGSQYIFLCRQNNVLWDQDNILSGFMWPRWRFMWPIYYFMWPYEVLCDQDNFLRGLDFHAAKASFYVTKMTCYVTKTTSYTWVRLLLVCTRWRFIWPRWLFRS